MTPLNPADWERWIRPGSRVFLGSGAACPHALLRSLLAQAAALKDVELVHTRTLGPAPWLDAVYADTFTANSFVSGPELRAAVQAGQADHTPCFLSEVPGLFLDGIVPLDVALVQVAPPDAHGFCSLGVSVEVVAAACRAARTVIAQINPRMPVTHGQSFIPCSRIDAALEVTEELPEFDPGPPTTAMTMVARHVAQLVPDGSTMRVGVGPLPVAVVGALAGHRNLGLHTDVLGDAWLPLLASGVVNNAGKTLHPRKTVVSFCLGRRALYDFVHDNPHVEFHPTEYVNNPAVIARHDRLVAVISAREVDLSGQVVGDALGGGFFSGIGGQVDFIRGAALSRGGIPIIALPATSEDGTRSNIVSALRDGAGVVTSRGDVHYVVTEYGIATLRGRSLRERVLELIQVAHPTFRDALREEAHALGWLPAYQRVSPGHVDDCGDLEVKRVKLRDGQTYLLRPLHASDIRRLQEFFYSHTLETIQQRYGHAVTRMTRERAYDLVNVDQSRDLALAIFETQGPREIIHAVGRYYLDRDGRSAEAAFVVRETKRRCGMTSTLLQTLLEVARKRGLTSLWGRVRRDNLPMLALFRRFGGQTETAPDADPTDVDIRLPLQAVAPPPTAPTPAAAPASGGRAPRRPARDGSGRTRK